MGNVGEVGEIHTAKEDCYEIPPYPIVGVLVRLSGDVVLIESVSIFIKHNVANRIGIKKAEVVAG